MRTCMALLVCGSIILSEHTLGADLIEWGSGSLFPACDIAPESREPGYQPYVPMTKFAPIFPSSAVRRGIEAVVLVEFVITPDGSVTNATIVESGFTENSVTVQEAFHSSSLQAVSKFRYTPATQNGNPVSTEGVRNLINFSYQGEEERLKLGSQYDRANRKVANWLKKKQPEKALEFLAEVIESDKHAGVVLAAYLYLRGLTQIQLHDMDGAVESLVSVKSFYESLRFNPNSIKLHTYAGITLAMLYGKKERWSESTNEFKSALFVHRRADMPSSPRIISGYANLGISASRLQDWCTAAESFGRAIELSEKSKSNIPENWRRARLYAQQQTSAATG